MSLNKVTVTLSDRLYRRLQAMATENNQNIADILVAGAEAMFLLEEDEAQLPADVADELAAMRYYSDEALWQATQPHLSPTQQTRLEELTHRQGVESLTEAEQKELDMLLADYDRSVLYRAQAFALLTLRGHTIPDLNDPILA